MAKEIWDAYDRDLKPIEGALLIRGEEIPDCVYHLVSDVIVKHTDGTWLLMRRAPEKHLGGMWEATAGGSALRGESPRACAERELLEETGIRSSDLTEVGRVTDDENHTIYVEFLCVTDAEKDGVRLQEGETDDYRWVTKEELLRMEKEELVTERMQRYLDELKAPLYRIRLFSEEYRDDLIFMILQAREALGIGPRIREDLLDIRKNYFEKGDLFWVAVDAEDRVIGSIGFSRIGDTDEAFLHRLFIKPACKRKGIGTALLQTAEKAMKEKGIRTVRVHLGGSKEIWHESYAFYPKHGFTEYEPRYMKKEL